LTIFNSVGHTSGCVGPTYVSFTAPPRGVCQMPNQKPNVVLLTSGLSGSSVLSGLISRAGYWTGDKTHKKEYDTYENQELINLNLQLFQCADYGGNYTTEFSPDAIARIASLAKTIDDRPFRQFLQTCGQHRPWIWKDPRLWLTIGFWRNLLNLEECRFILLTRSIPHSWVSATLRRQIRSYGSFKKYEEAIRNSLTGFLHSNGLSYLHITFENLVVHPEETIRKLNTHLGTELSVKDLDAVYNRPLYKTPRSSVIDYFKAILIYVKNYSQRMDLQEKTSNGSRH
jgi:hypothetical protein